MDLQEYQDFVIGLASEATIKSQETQLNTAALGLAGEAGEVAEHIKKFMFHGKAFDREAFINELSDVMWYLVLGAHAVGCGIQDIIDANVKKLNARYKSGKFTHEEFLKKEYNK